MALKNFDDFTSRPVNESGGGDLIGMLPKSITSVKEAEQLLLTLAKTGNFYHFDDDPADLVGVGGNDLFTPEEAEAVGKLVDEAFDVCQQHYNMEHGFWEGLIKNVFIGFTAFTADEDPATGEIYIVNGNGGPGNVKQTTIADYEKALADNTIDNGMDEDKIEDWFRQLKDVA